MKIKNSVIFVTVLCIWAAFSVVYIGWNSWQQFKAKEAQAAFNNGASQGYQQAIIDLATQAQKCQPVPLNLGNDKDGKPMTMEVIATACLQQQGEGQPAAADSAKTEKK
jgi:hypothetical protein